MRLRSVNTKMPEAFLRVLKDRAATHLSFFVHAGRWPTSFRGNHTQFRVKSISSKLFSLPLQQDYYHGNESRVKSCNFGSTLIL